MNGYYGYCKEFRRNMSGLTVGDLIKELQKFPESAEISCCGDFNLFIHYAPTENYICIDNSSLESEYNTEE